MDYENDPVTLNGVIIPNWMTFDAASRVLSGLPTSNNVGVHQVIITVTDGLFITSHQFTITVGNVGIEKVSTLLSKVYPNPADDFIIFEFSGKVSQIEVMDISGKVLINQMVEDGSTQVKLDLSGLDKGLYMYRVSEDDVQQTGKLIVN